MDRPNNPYPNYPQHQRVMVAPQAQNMPQDYRHEGQPYPHYPIYDVAPDAPPGFDIYKYIRIAINYRWLIIGITLSALILAAVITFLMTPVYRATSSIQIDRQTMEVVAVKNLRPEEATSGLEFFQTQYELLGSRSLAERVSTTLGLAEDKEFLTTEVSLLRSLKDLVFGGAADVEDEGDAIERQQRKVVDKLKKILTISPVRGSRIARINVDHADPAMAQKIANGYAETFIADNLDRRFDATSYARKFLEERLQQLKIKLEESEKQAVKYAEQQGIISLNDNKSLSTTDLEAVNIKLAEVRANRIKKELEWKQAAQASGFGLTKILESKAVQENRKLRSELAAQYQQKLAIYKPAFPAMVELRNQIKELDRSVQTEVEAIKGAIEVDFLAAQEEEQTLQAQLDSTKIEVVDQRNRSIEYNILQREVDTNRQLYDGLLQRYKEIGVAGGVGTNNISIVDRANLPKEPRSPNLPLNLLLALAAGLLLGVVTALTLDYIDDTFRSPEDIERDLGMTVIGVVPKPRAGISVDEEMFDVRSGMAEAYRSLRTGLQFATSDGLPKTLFITSSKPSEGKTTTTIALAKSLAHLGLNVLLIDGDLRNASVHKRLRISNEVGLSNYLTGSKLPEECVTVTDTEGLAFMPSGPLPPNPAELLSGNRFVSLLALAHESFNVVLIDGPPVMGLADAPLISSYCQSTLLVIAAHETRKNVVRVAVKRLQYARANIIGALLSKFDSATAGYGYGYGYGDYEYHSYGVKQLPSPGA